MENIDMLKNIKDKMKVSRMTLIYFGSKSCGVCSAVKPRIFELMGNYPLVSCFDIEIEDIPQVSSEFSIFTIPAILLFVDGKEILRQARFINIQDFIDSVDRYYNFVFDKN